MQPMHVQPMQPAPKKSGGAGLWALLGCLGCFGLVAVVGAIGLAFFLVRSESTDVYSPVGIRDPYGDPLADPYVAPAPIPPPGDLAADVERFRVPVTPDDPRRGPEGAPVTIVELGDFQCPFCARASATMRDLEREYAGQVRFVWKDNPLPFHVDAMPAAIVAREARAQQGDGGFWRMHDLFFADTRALGGRDLERHARTLGLDLRSVRSALSDRRYRAQIEAGQTLARQIGATGTPTFFVNGRKISGAQPIDQFRSVIDEELARALALQATGVAPERLYDEITRDGRTTPLPTPAAAAAPTEDPDRVHAVPVEGSAQRGPDDALVTIVAFSDFQCPFCSRAAPTLDRIEREYGTDVRIVFKHYPLPFHRDAGPAAEAALEVRAQRGDDAFWRMHDILFENQRDLSTEALVRYARQAGASGTGVSRALAEGTHRAAVQRDIELGQRIGRLGTPTFFINGRQLRGAQPFEAFESAIERELAAARAMVQRGIPRARVYEEVMASAE